MGGSHGFKCLVKTMLKWSILVLEQGKRAGLTNHNGCNTNFVLSKRSYSNNIGINVGFYFNKCKELPCKTVKGEKMLIVGGNYGHL